MEGWVSVEQTWRVKGTGKEIKSWRHEGRVLDQDLRVSITEAWPGSGEGGDDGCGGPGLAAAGLHMPHQTRLNAESSENY